MPVLPSGLLREGHGVHLVEGPVNPELAQTRNIPQLQGAVLPDHPR
jgi:hypothetical protein